MKEQNGNGFCTKYSTQAIEEMKAFQGDSFSLERINLAELERRTGVSRSRLRRLKKNSFQDLPRSTKGSKHTVTKTQRLYRPVGQFVAPRSQELLCSVGAFATGRF